MDLLCIGCTGFIGSPLRKALIRAGHHLRVVYHTNRPTSRHQNESWVSYDSDWLEHLDSIDGIINLAGESVADGLWTARRKNLIVDSRTGLCRRIVDRLGRNTHLPQVWINASAVGYYGDRGAETLNEDAEIGTGFLAQTCGVWESEVERACRLGVRTLNLRFGVVLAPGGGFMKRLEPLFQKGLGTILGSGDQYMSWIHRDDVVDCILFSLDSDLQGPVNVVAPNPVTQKEFALKLAQCYSKKARFRIPALWLKLGLGEAASLMLFSQKAVPRRLLDAGYLFHYAHIQDALNLTP